jgi:predicted enzyme related to lactoylglutathione lyase
MSARLIEIELRVRDVARPARFYGDLVGVTPTDPSLLMLNIYRAAGPISSSRIGFAVGDLAATHARLTAANVEVLETPADRPWGRTAAYRDPDGNTVSLTETRRSD